MPADADADAGHDAAPAAGALTRRLVTVTPGGRFGGAAGPGGELWFVIAGAGRLDAGQWAGTPLGRDTGLWLPPEAEYRLDAGPDGVSLDVVALPAGPAQAQEPAAPRMSQLRDCAVEQTGDRRFRVLLGPGRGCEAATQFLGEIPPGRAPEHSHPYNEVVLVLEGAGVLHAGDTDRTLARGTTVHLPPDLPHCLENTGTGTLVVLGVFHPGGSPAQKTAG
ncbi:MAG TPA: cupin domain-containing protein [Streptosporangiaceae bacterium]